MDYLKTNKWAKRVAYGIMAAFVIVFIVLCCVVGAKNKTIRKYKEAQKAQIEYAQKVNAYADSLARLECVTVNNTVVINQKGIVNTTQANQISKTVATYTREEVLNALDSLQRINNGK